MEYYQCVLFVIREFVLLIDYTSSSNSFRIDSMHARYTFVSKFIFLLSILFLFRENSLDTIRGLSSIEVRISLILYRDIIRQRKVRFSKYSIVE